MANIDVYEAMRTLRAVRRLRPDAIPDDALHRVLDAARFAPTGGNRQPWRMIVVRNPESKQRLAELYAEVWTKYAEFHRSMLKGVPDGVRTAQEKQLAAGNYLAAHFAETPVIVVFCFNPQEMAITDADLGRPSVVGGGSVYPAVQNLLLACRAEGLGCVLTTLLCMKESEVRPLLGIPEPWATCAAIPIGYPVLGGHGPVTRRPLSKLTYADTWGEAFE